MSTDNLTGSADQGRMALDSGEPTSRKKIVSWALWDWGTQPVSTIIVTFVFVVYLTSDSFGDVNHTTQTVGIATTIAGILVAILAPALGQNSDRRGHILRDLRWLTWGLAALSASLFFVKADPSFLILGVVLYAVTVVVNEIAGVNSNALLNDVASGHNVGRVSGFGWGMGYLGGIVSLLLFNYAFIQDGSWLGVPHDEGLNIRVSMVASAIWIVLFTIPIFANLRDRSLVDPPITNPYGGGVFGAAAFMYAELFRSIARIWRNSRQTSIFLIASVLFRDGLNAIFTVGGMVAAGTFGLSAGEVIMFGAAANVLAGVATILFGLVDDRIGPKKVILISLGALTLLSATIFALHDQGPIIFWTAGLALTLFVGPAQAAARSYLARLTPEGMSGEIFGLYATTGRMVSWVSMAVFTGFISIGQAVTGSENTQYWGVLGIAIVLLAGFLVMIPIKEPKRA